MKVTHAVFIEGRRGGGLVVARVVHVLLGRAGDDPPEVVELGLAFVALGPELKRKIVICEMCVYMYYTCI